MAINPSLVSIKKVEDIPTVPLSELATGQMFGYTGGGDLKKVATSEILDFVKSGIKGNATQSNAPTTYDAVTYPDGLFEKWEVTEPIDNTSTWYTLADTATKLLFPITAQKLEDNYIYFHVTNGVVTLFSKAIKQPIENITNITNENTYNLDPSQIVPSEALYNDVLETLAGDILKRVDYYTGEDVNYKETTKWIDGSNITDAMVDNIIFIKRASKYYKRIYSGYADVRWFGAKGNGVDLGKNNYEGDHNAINEALRLCKKVKIENGTFIVKKPIVLNDENELFISSDAILKLGIASNCTLIKNSHVDIVTDGLGNPTYPVGFKRHSNIRLINEGLIDCNGWMQNRANDTVIAKDNPDVIDTDRFKDALDPFNDYIGFAIKLADIDNLYIKSGRIKNPRTYGFLFGGLRNYKIEDIIADRTYGVVNQDFMHFHGDCYDGKIKNIYGVSGDDLIAVTTREAGTLTLRSGDFKRLEIDGVYYFGIDPTSSPTNQIEMASNGIESGFKSHRVLRLSYSGNDIIDDIYIKNINATESVRFCPIVLSVLPFSDGTTEAEKYSGTGYIGKVTIDNLSQKNSLGIIGTSDYVTIKELNIFNTIDVRLDDVSGRSIIDENENFLDVNPDFTHSKIERLNINNLTSILGAVNPSQPYIKWRGEITNCNVDNFKVKSAEGTSGYVDSFISSNVKRMWLTNSSLTRYNKIFDLTNTDCYLKESNCFYDSTNVESQLFARASSNTLILNDNSYGPYLGMMALSTTGMKIYKSDGWVLI